MTMQTSEKRKLIKEIIDNLPSWSIDKLWAIVEARRKDVFDWMNKNFGGKKWTDWKEHTN